MTIKSFHKVIYVADLGFRKDRLLRLFAVSLEGWRVEMAVFAPLYINKFMCIYKAHTKSNTFRKI